MARDRQRAKQRRRKADAPGTHPDPLDHASAEVDIAKLAEQGAEPIGDSDDAPAVEPAPDELDPAFGGRLDPAVREDHAMAPRKERGRLLTFLRHCVDELRRVQWPDRKHVFQATAVVLGFVLIAGGWLGLMDAIWQPVVNAIL